VFGRVPHPHSSDPDPHPDSAYCAFWRAAHLVSEAQWARGAAVVSAALPGVARLRDRFTVDAGDAMASDVGCDSARLRGQLWECSLVVGVADVTLVASCVEGWVLGAGIVYLSVSSYDEVRDGANEVAWLLYGASLATFLAILCLIREHKNPIEQATLWMMQIVLASLHLSWMLLVLFALVTLCLGSWAWRSLPDGPKRARAKAAVRTSRFALAMPTLGF